jgi:hypothetical protein
LALELIQSQTGEAHLSRDRHGVIEIPFSKNLDGLKSLDSKKERTLPTPSSLREKATVDLFSAEENSQCALEKSAGE